MTFGVRLAPAAIRAAPFLFGIVTSAQSAPSSSPPASSAASSAPAGPTAASRAVAPGVERSIADALAWLAAHQRKDGRWDRWHFDDRCPPDDLCTGTAMRNPGAQFDVSISALAALAFVGAGHTHQQGPYARNLTRAIEYLLAQQDAGGSFAPGNDFEVYNNAHATLLLAECQAATRDPLLDPPLRRAVAWLAAAQQPQGGWDYHAEPTGRNDSNITAWVLLALQSASACGIAPPRETLWRAARHFLHATLPDGRVRYADEDRPVQIDRATGQHVQQYGTSTTAAALAVAPLLNWSTKHPAAQAQAALLRAGLPSAEVLMWKDPTGLQSETYWYFGTLAARAAGPPLWSDWNRQVRHCILEYQERRDRRHGRLPHAFGSWPPYGPSWGSQWGRTGGRVYVTAVNVLTLELCFGRRPAFLDAAPLIGLADLWEYARAQAHEEPRELVRLVERCHPDLAEPVLIWLLSAERPDVRLNAALALARLDSPMGRAELLKHRPAAMGEARQFIDQALAQIDGLEFPAAYGCVTQVDQTAGLLLFDMRGGRVYYGQIVRIMRAGRDLCEARVERRFSADGVAVAAFDGPPPQPGDDVVFVPATQEAGASDEPADAQ